MEIQKTDVVRILPTKVWIEGDIFGHMHVMRQHEGQEAVTFCTFFYDYRHTSNAQIRRDAEDMARSLGAADPVEYLLRVPKFN